MSRFSILIILFLVGGSVFAQSPFKTKKEEKFYEKINSYYEKDDLEKIISNENAILDYAKGRKDTVEAAMYFFLADAYQYSRNDLKSAVKYYQKVYDTQKSVGVKGESLSNTAFNLAYILQELGQYDKCEALYREVLDLDKKNGTPAEEYIYYTGLSLLEFYVSTEQPSKGLETIKDFRRDIKKNTLNEAMMNYYTGAFYTATGEYSKAEKSLLKDLEILEAIGMYPSIEYVSGLNYLGQLYKEQGKLALSEEVYLDAADMISRLQGEWSDYELSLKSSQGLLYTQLGNFEKAEELYKSLIVSDKEFYGDESFAVYADALNLGTNYVYAGQYAKAEEQLNLARKGFTEMFGEKSDYTIKTMRLLTNLYVRSNQLQKAKEVGTKTLELSTEVTTDKYQQAFDYFNLGEVYAKYGDLENAKKYHEHAAMLRRRSVGESHPKYAESTKKLAINEWKAGNIKAARENYEKTFDNYFGQINMVFPVLSEDEKAKFYYNNLRPAFEQFNSFIVETSAEEKELLSEMYNYQLATKGLILSATNKVKDAILNSGDSVVIGKYETWISQKEALAQLFSTSDLAAEIRNKRIDSLNNLANTLEKELSKASGDFAETFANRDFSWKDVQAKLKPGEAAVEVIRFRDFNPDSSGVYSDEVYYAALIITSQTTDFPEMVLMRNGKEMETKFLANYRNAIKYKINENFSYTLFWKPIANKLQGVKKVYFSPDGVFNQISIYTLRNPASGNFTIDEMEIQVVTNTKDLVAFAGTKAKSSGDSYLFGYPNYNMGVIDSKVEKQGGSAADNITEAAKEDRGVRGASRGVRGTRGNEENQLESLTRGGALPRGIRGNLLRYMRSNQMLALLPGTKREVNLIDSLYGVKHSPVIKYLSNDALEDSIKIVNNPRTLHIATHGFFLESEEDGLQDNYVQNPLLRSGLILAGANSYISSGQISDQVAYREDGILTAYEAMNLNLNNTELVVLSACETGLGEVKNGEGVYGLQRAFQVAGADAIIMSMWTVDDDATQELMTNFYEEWLSGKTKHDAFITAQKRLKDKWKSPYYWGAFIMVGF